jgi:hypothetical protein
VCNAALDADVAKFTDAGASDPLARAIAGSINDVREKSTIPALRRTVIAVGVALGSLMVVGGGFTVTSLRSEVAATRNEVKTEIASTRNELKADIAAVRSELKGDVAAFRSEVAGLRSEMIGFRETTNAKFDAANAKLDILLRQQATPRP